MKLPEYTGQKTGIYYLPEINNDRSWKSCWETFIGGNHAEKRFNLDFGEGEGSLLDIIWWCEEQCKGVVFLNLYGSDNFIGFHQKSDAVHFKLKWMGEQCS